MPHLRISSDGGVKETFPLGGREHLVVGRSRESDLMLPDVSLSRRHAELRRTPAGWVLRDLGSMNGTRLNGVRVREERLLRDGDVVGLASFSLVFLESEAGSSEAAAGWPARLRDISELATKTGAEVGELVHQSRLLGVLTRAASALVGGLGMEELFNTLLGHLMDAIPAERGAVALLEGEPPALVVRAARAREGAPPAAVSPALREQVMAGGTALFLPRIQDELGTARAALAAPLLFTGPPEGGDRVAGLAWLDVPAASARFNPEHLKLLTAVTNLAASRLESMRLREETRDKRRLEEDLRGAARIQASLLPEVVPRLKGYELAGSSRLCSAVGADYYDFALDRGHLLLALGDVAGKGLAAALLMATLRAAVRAVWLEPEPLPQVMNRVNQNLHHSVPENRFATLFLARLQPVQGTVDWVNAGHAAPLLVRADGRGEALTAGGTVLGVFASVEYAQGRTRLDPGDVLVVFSDGVIETANASATDFGPERLAEVVRRERDRDASGLIDALQTGSEQGLGAAHSADDHTFLVLKRL